MKSETKTGHMLYADWFSLEDFAHVTYFRFLIGPHNMPVYYPHASIIHTSILFFDWSKTHFQDGAWNPGFLLVGCAACLLGIRQINDISKGRAGDLERKRKRTEGGGIFQGWERVGRLYIGNWNSLMQSLFLGII